MIKRRLSRKIYIGPVAVGGDAPISVQSMTKTDTRDARATISQIAELAERGCDIIRCAVPDMEAARALKEIKNGIRIPLIADIHFDYRLALEALASGVDGLRLNPGNISDPWSLIRSHQQQPERVHQLTGFYLVFCNKIFNKFMKALFFKG